MSTKNAAASRRRGLLAVLCALALIVPPARASLYEVMNTNSDATAGSGSLGGYLTTVQSEPAGSADSIFFEPYLSPTISPINAVTLMNNDSLTINGNTGTTINFTPGGMTVTGATLYLNGLTASGLTVDTNGILSTSYSTINGLTLQNGGIYQTRDNSFTSGLTLAGTGGTVDTFGSNPTMSGLLGSADLTVTDTSSGKGGILTLIGASPSFAGNTIVNAGTLQLGVASALPQTGNLTTTGTGIFDLNGFTQTLTTVNNAAGTIKTGSGILNATTYNGGGTLSVALQGGVTNLHITGTAALNSGTLAVTGHPALGLYTVVSAGTLTGTFASSALPYGITDSLTCTDGLSGACLIDILSDSPFTFAGQSSNQAAIGNALNVA
ncbi:MAG TPA: hypothetical protein VH309_11535, partial [Elusimicrobiota bacterium]|nr:hypothetical protein [Elusimicrobiota bacterium]